MLHCARKEWLSAASVFAVACAFRSTGIFLPGFILWGMLVEPVLARHKVCPVITPRVVPTLLLSHANFHPRSLDSSLVCRIRTRAVRPGSLPVHRAPTYRLPRLLRARLYV